MKRNYNYPKKTNGSRIARRIREEHQRTCSNCGAKLSKNSQPVKLCAECIKNGKHGEFFTSDDLQWLTGTGYYAQ